MRWPFVSRERFVERVEQVSELKQTLADERAARSAERERWQQERIVEIAKLHTMYERIIETQASAQKAAVEHAMNLVNFGMPKRTEAVVEEREPDAMTRAAREVQEETITRASEALKHKYAEIGVIITEEELRAEAITLVTGGRWKPPAALAPFLKD